MQIVKLFSFLGAVSVVTIGLVGCSKPAESNDKTASGTKTEAKNDLTPKDQIPTESGVNTPSTTPDSKDATKDAPGLTTKTVPTATPATKLNGKEVPSKLDPAPKAASSKKISGGFLGDYYPTVTAEQKKQIAAMAKQMQAQTQKNGAKAIDVDAEINKMDSQLAKITLSLKADGAFSISGMGSSKKGTYSVNGNQITLTPEIDKTDTSPNAGKPLVVTFDGKTKTLSGGEGPMKMVFKKKN